MIQEGQFEYRFSSLKDFQIIHCTVLLTVRKDFTALESYRSNSHTKSFMRNLYLNLFDWPTQCVQQSRDFLEKTSPSSKVFKEEGKRYLEWNNLTVVS